MIMLYSKTPAALGLPMHTEYDQLSEGEGSTEPIAVSSLLTYFISNSKHIYF